MQMVCTFKIPFHSLHSPTPTTDMDQNEPSSGWLRPPSHADRSSAQPPQWQPHVAMGPGPPFTTTAAQYYAQPLHTQ